MDMIRQSDLERFHNLSTDLFCIVRDGRFARVNHAWTDLLGWAEEDLLGKNCMDFVHPEDRERTLDTAKDLQNRDGLVEFENRYIHQDGSLRWLSWRATMDNVMEVIYGVARDVTDRKKIEDQIRLSEQRLSAHVRNLPIVYVECRSDLEVVTWNQAASTLFSWTSPSKLYLHERLIPEDRRGDFLQFWNQTLERRAGATAEFETTMGDGRVLMCRWYFTPLPESDGTQGMALLIEDRSAVIQIQNELTEHRENLETILARRSRETQAINEQLFAEVNERLKVEKTLRASQALIKRELAMAADIQRCIMVRNAAPWNGLSFSALYQPMEMVSGDYIDIFREQQAVFLLCVDVSGHGVPAALITMAAKQSFSTIIRGDLSPAEILRRVNVVLSEEIRTHDYLTAFLVKVDNQNHVTYSCAGHTPAVLFRSRTGSVELIDTPGTFVAAFAAENSHFHDGTLALHSGDRLILYTDGITERKNPQNEEFGIERFLDVVKNARELPHAQLADHCTRAVEEFAAGGPIKDDIAFLSVELTPNWGEFVASFNEAVRLMRAGELNSAQKEIDIGDGIVPSFPRLQYLKAKILYLKGDQESAATVISKHLSLHARDTAALRLAHRIYSASGKVQEASNILATLRKHGVR